MTKLIQRINMYFCLGIALTISASLVEGCEYFPESTFTLASESRLPKWVTLPSGFTRANVSITMSYYIKPWGSSAQFVLQNTRKQILNKIEGKVKCREPFHLKVSTQGFTSGYPTFEAITVDGVTDIIEHRKMEPRFYVTDDAAVWKQYWAIGCS